MLDAGLVCSRLLHDAALIMLFGASLFPLYAFSSRASDLTARLDRQLQATLTAATLVALLSGVSWFLFTTADMTGTSLDALDGGALWSVLGETAFGQIWLARLALIVAIVCLVGFRKIFVIRDHPFLLPTLNAAALASLAGVGHTQMNEGHSACRSDLRRQCAPACRRCLAWWPGPARDHSCDDSSDAIAAERS